MSVATVVNNFRKIKKSTYIAAGIGLAVIAGGGNLFSKVIDDYEAATEAATNLFSQVEQRADRNKDGLLSNSEVIAVLDDLGRWPLQPMAHESDKMTLGFTTYFGSEINRPQQYPIKFTLSVEDMGRYLRK
jgi:hypothetical protein|tara:strand:- start:2090 stop:2482 length:393 start_codon:yes stop_codon:yes gene_type:complete